jgi:glyoxylase-like metal-dependent hydrolase (beta-lactamase superfamily II)
MKEPIMSEQVNLIFYKLHSYPPYALPFWDTEIVVVSDGPLDLGIPEDSFRGISKEEIDGHLLRNFLPTDRVVIEQNIPLLTLGGKRILFETGIGSLKMFGPHSGRLQTSLKEAGIDPGSIDAVVCSHPHPDHIRGICTDDGVPLFPNAQIYLSENDFNFWTDEKLLGMRWGPVSQDRSQQSSAGTRPDRIFQRRAGVVAWRTGHVHSWSHERACLLHRDLGKSVDVPDWRSLASSCSAARATAKPLHL